MLMTDDWLLPILTSEDKERDKSNGLLLRNLQEEDE